MRVIAILQKNLQIGGMARKRKLHVGYSHCTSCGVDMDDMACCIEWHAVYVSNCVKQHMIRTGRLPTHEELIRMDRESGSDPCGDCCCGSCGSRKAQPCTVCC